jgi:hypothetical protein
VVGRAADRSALGGLAALRHLSVLALGAEDAAWLDRVPALTVTHGGNEWPAPRLAAFLRGTLEMPKLAATVRDAWIVKARAGDKPSTVKAGGSALLDPAEAWPECALCRRPMPLLVQVSARALGAPDDASESPGSIVQLFYCTSEEPLCEVDAESWQRNDDAMLLRRLPAAGLAWRAPPALARPVKPKHLSKLEPKRDQPHARDLEARCGIYGKAGRNLQGDKLGGWPRWEQVPDWPRCARCDRTMSQLVQLESDGFVGHRFGDCGRAHLFACDEHPDSLDWRWQSS